MTGFREREEMLLENEGMETLLCTGRTYKNGNYSYVENRECANELDGLAKEISKQSFQCAIIY